MKVIDISGPCAYLLIPMSSGVEYTGDGMGFEDLRVEGVLAPLQAVEFGSLNSAFDSLSRTQIMTWIELPSAELASLTKKLQDALQPYPHGTIEIDDDLTNSFPGWLHVRVSQPRAPGLFGFGQSFGAVVVWDLRAGVAASGNRG